MHVATLAIRPAATGSVDSRPLAAVHDIFALRWLESRISIEHVLYLQYGHGINTEVAAVTETLDAIGKK